MMDNNYHDGNHDPDCWCYDGNNGRSSNMGCFGTIIIAVLLFAGALVVLTLIITALGVEVRDIPAELLTILLFIIMAAIAAIVSEFKR